MPYPQPPAFSLGEVLILFSIALIAITTCAHCKGLYENRKVESEERYRLSVLSQEEYDRAVERAKRLRNFYPSLDVRTLYTVPYDHMGIS